MNASYDETLSAETIDEALVVRFRQPWLFESEHVDAAERCLLRLIESGQQPKLLLDLHNITYLATPALAMLVRLYHALAARNGELRLFDVSPEIYEVLAVTQLTRLFRVVPAKTRS